MLGLFGREKRRNRKERIQEDCMMGLCDLAQIGTAIISVMCSCLPAKLREKASRPWLV